MITVKYFVDRRQMEARWVGKVCSGNCLPRPKNQIPKSLKGRNTFCGSICRSTVIFIESRMSELRLIERDWMNF